MASSLLWHGGVIRRRDVGSSFRLATDQVEVDMGHWARGDARLVARWIDGTLRRGLAGMLRDLESLTRSAGRGDDKGNLPPRKHDRRAATGIGVARMIRSGSNARSRRSRHAGVTGPEIAWKSRYFGIRSRPTRNERPRSLVVSSRNVHLTATSGMIRKRDRRHGAYLRRCARNRSNRLQDKAKQPGNSLQHA